MDSNTILTVIIAALILTTLTVLYLVKKRYRKYFVEELAIMAYCYKSRITKQEIKIHMTFGIDESNGNLFFIKNRRKTGHVKFMRLSDYSGCVLYTGDESTNKKLGKTTPKSSLSLRFIPKNVVNPVIDIELYNVLDYAGFRRAREFGKRWTLIVNKVCTK